MSECYEGRIRFDAEDPDGAMNALIEVMRDIIRHGPSSKFAQKIEIKHVGTRHPDGVMRSCGLPPEGYDKPYNNNGILKNGFLCEQWLARPKETVEVTDLPKPILVWSINTWTEFMPNGRKD